MSEKKKKPQKLKARLPRGFVDREAEEIRATHAMMEKIRTVFERYGFDPVETPAFEFTDCLGKFLPDTDRPNEGVFSVQDDDEQWMSLRYDLTAPLARHVAENINEIQLPYRTYRAGYVFRNEKPGPGRFRQFMQFDADSVGAPGVQADAEMAMMMADTMEALGIKRGDYIVRVNNRKVLDGVLESIGLGGDENAGRRLGVMRSLDKYDRLGSIEVQKLLGGGRQDESGDWTPGLNLTERQLFKLNMMLECQDAFSKKKAPTVIKQIKRTIADGPKGAEIAYEVVEIPFLPQSREHSDETFANPDAILFVLPLLLGWEITGERGSHSMRPPAENVRDISSELSWVELVTIKDIVRATGYGPDRIRIDPSVVRGLEYYTGTVYECELNFPVTNEKGEEVVFGSVAGGGRYDGLVKRFTGQEVPATGFSIGVSRLMTALRNLGKLEGTGVSAPVLVTVMDGDTDSLGRYQKFVQDLRNANIRAELYQGNWKKFGNQLKYADRRGCPLAIIQGSDERANGKLQIKDLIEGRKQAEAIASNEEWREERPGQYEINEADLVEEVKKRLAEQAGASG